MTRSDNDTWMDLPIRDFMDGIIAAVDTNQVTIVTAETGAGKSTQLPQYLAEHGYDRVIVTQPRILAARNLSNRVREEWAQRNLEDSEPIIGYRTAHERDDSGQTKILYCTDGLQLVREITGSGTTERQVLVLDEVHEWNENMEVLVAWAKKRCQEEPSFKVVIMSATIETGSLAEYFETDAVINVPGRHFEVVHSRGTDILSEIFERLRGPASNMLVFLPGKAEIQDVSDAVAKVALEAKVPVIPLHSQLEATAQQEAFANYPNGKIILATNIAQTSVTIDDVDVVIDSGLERRNEVRQGVEGLFIAQISQADCLQRAGRAGRTKPGEYVLAQYDTMPCVEFDERSEYATPEILRKHIDRLTLRLANIGIDIEMLDFYHDPSRKAILQAKRTLVALGALTKSGSVTKTGRAMEQFPVSSSYARMLVEAGSYSKSVQRKLAAIIAIQEVGGIVRGGTRYTGWRSHTRQNKSDLLAQYDVYLALPTILEEDYEELGIIGKNVTKAEEVMERLERDLLLDDEPLTPIDQTEQEPLLRSIIAGQIDQLWTIDHDGQAVHIQTKRRRELSSATVVRWPTLIAGTPFDLQIPTHNGDLETLHLVQGVTAVSAQWLEELAPNLFQGRRTKIAYDPGVGGLAEHQQVRFGGQVLVGGATPILDNTPRNRRAFRDAFAEWAYEQLRNKTITKNRFSRHRMPSVSVNDLREQVERIAGGVTNLDQLDQFHRDQLLALADPKSYHG
ncbi:ATP-dependent RNA helicase, partial [Patescibacteria group bacterium]